MQRTASENAKPDVPAIASAFIHRATPENSQGDYTYLDGLAANVYPNAVLRAAPAHTVEYSVYLDHPIANGNPGAVLLVTQNRNPGEAAEDSHVRRIRHTHGSSMVARALIRATNNSTHAKNPSESRPATVW